MFHLPTDTTPQFLIIKVLEVFDDNAMLKKYLSLLRNITPKTETHAKDLPLVLLKAVWIKV